jgi:hypothetical protein
MCTPDLPYAIWYAYLTVLSDLYYFCAVQYYSLLIYVGTRYLPNYFWTIGTYLPVRFGNLSARNPFAQAYTS